MQCRHRSHIFTNDDTLSPPENAPQRGKADLGSLTSHGCSRRRQVKLNPISVLHSKDQTQIQHQQIHRGTPCERPLQHSTPNMAPNNPSASCDFTATMRCMTDAWRGADAQVSVRICMRHSKSTSDLKGWNHVERQLIVLSHLPSTLTVPGELYASLDSTRLGRVTTIL